MYHTGKVFRTAGHPHGLYFETTGGNSSPFPSLIHGRKQCTIYLSVSASQVISDVSRGCDVMIQIAGLAIKRSQKIYRRSDILAPAFEQILGLLLVCINV